MRNHRFDRLVEHWGHEIECVIYGPEKNPENIAIECVDCGMVLVDENPELEDSETTQCVKGE